MSTHSIAPLDLPANKTMLDAVMFVASLVSKSDEIDIQLDRVRAITARHTTGQLTKEDDRALREVYNYLEDYLVKKESLRSFTQDSIREKLYVYLHGNRQSSLRQPLSIMWTIAIGGALASVLIPDAIIPLNVKLTLAITIFFVTINLGAAWMFWTGLKNFKDKIRQAYLPICVGIALVALSLLQALFAVAIGQDNSIWFHYITSGIGIPIAEVLIYIGIRRFAQIGGVNSKLMSTKLILALCIGFSILAVLIPRPESGVPDWAIIFSLTLLTIGAVLSAAAVRITALVRGSLSKAYKRPMTWFMAMLLATTFSCILYAIMQIIATVEHPFDPRGFGLLPLVISGFVTLKAGTSFRQIDTTTVPGKSDTK